MLFLRVVLNNFQKSPVRCERTLHTALEQQVNRSSPWMLSLLNGGVFSSVKLAMSTFLAPVKFCVIFTLVTLGAFHIFIDTLTINYAVPSTVVIISLLCLVMFTVRVPAPDKDTVEKIIGINPLYSYVNENVVRSIAHRGAGLDAPENSLEAFNNCAEKGVDFIELDVHMTKDGVAIVFHDDDLERMSNIKGYIEISTYRQLKHVDISVNHPFRERFEKVHIPTLQETIEQLLKNQQKMFLDVKYNNPKMVETILNAFKNNNELYTRAIVSSFYPNLIYTIRKRDPKIVCSLAWRPYAFQAQTYSYPVGPGYPRSKNYLLKKVAMFLDWLHGFTLPKLTYYLLGISVILLHKDCISGETVMDWQNKGVRVMAWTVNHPAEKQYFSKILKITYLTDTLTGENNAHTA